MNRRSLLSGILAFACAPAIVRASSLMPVNPSLATPASNVFIGDTLLMPDGSKWTVERIYIPATPCASDPLGQRAYIGWKTRAADGMQYGAVAELINIDGPPPQKVFDQFVADGVANLDRHKLLPGITPPIRDIHSLGGL